MKAAAIVLIVAGIAMLVFRGFSFQTKEKVIDAGPIEVSKTKDNSIGWPAWAGGAAIAAGLVILVSSRKKN